MPIPNPSFMRGERIMRRAGAGTSYDGAGSSISCWLGRR
jgi:hypothetical protein